MRKRSVFGWNPFLGSGIADLNCFFGSLIASVSQLCWADRVLSFSSLVNLQLNMIKMQVPLSIIRQNNNNNNTKGINPGEQKSYSVDKSDRTGDTRSTEIVVNSEFFSSLLWDDSMFSFMIISYLTEARVERRSRLKKKHVFHPSSLVHHQSLFLFTLTFLITSQTQKLLDFNN